MSLIDDAYKLAPSWANYLQSSWGIARTFSPKAALLYLLCYIYGLKPTITSGIRTRQQQDELLRRYKAGDPGVVYPPASNSLHLQGRAIDIATSNPSLAAQIASAIGVKAGLDFKDPVHFQEQ